MTVFEPTTPHRDRLAEALRGRTFYAVNGKIVADQVADALIEAEAVADPEWVAWLAEQLTRVKAVEGRLEAAEAEVEQLKQDHALGGAVAKAFKDERDEARAAVAAGLALADKYHQHGIEGAGAEWFTVARELRAALAPRGSGGSIPNPHEEQP